MMSSLSRSLTPSAMNWKIPWGPTRFGPMRAWMSPATLRRMRDAAPSKNRANDRRTAATATMTRSVTAQKGAAANAGTAWTRDLASASMASAVDFREDDVEAADDRHDVGDHEPLRHLLENVHRDEGGRADLEPVGVDGRVADEVDPRLAAGVLGAAVDLFRRRLERAGHLGHHGPLGDRCDGLPQDPDTLAHLVDPDHVPVEAVAQHPALSRPDADVEIELGVDRVRLVLPQVERNAGSPQVRAGEPVGDRVLRGDDCDVGEPVDEKLVVGDQVVVLVDLRLEVVEELLRLLEEAGREVGRDAADPGVVVRQPVPAEHLEEVVDLRPLPDPVEEGSERPHVDRERPECDEVGGDPVELADDDPDVFGPLGDLDPGELLDRPRPGAVAVHRGEVVEPVREGHELGVADPLADLLQRPVKV